MPRTRTFLISLANAGTSRPITPRGTALLRNLPSNFTPLKIRIQPCRTSETHRQACTYIPAAETAYPEEARCFIQIWELDQWSRGRGSFTRRRSGTEQDTAAQEGQNEFLAEFGGFIKEDDRNRYSFVTDETRTTIPSASDDRGTGKLILKIAQLQNDTIAETPLEVTVPIRGEVETRLEIGIAYQDSAEQRSYTDEYSRPVYHIWNMSKIIEDQLQAGGLRVSFCVRYNREIDDRTLDYYINHKSRSDPWPPAEQSLRQWLDGQTSPPTLAFVPSERLLSAIQNDENFPDASTGMAREWNTLYVNDAGEIGVGRFMLAGWSTSSRPIKSGISTLIDQVYRQHMDSIGEKPKVCKVAIFCHGSTQSLLIRGRNFGDTSPRLDPPKVGQNLGIPHLSAFVRSFIVAEGGGQRKLLSDNVIFALYACLAGRSSYAPRPSPQDEEAFRTDPTYGQQPGPEQVLGEGTFARVLRDELHLDGRFPLAHVYAHTNAGPAALNPHIRLFTEHMRLPFEIDLVNLFSETGQHNESELSSYKTPPSLFHRDAMFCDPRVLLNYWENPYRSAATLDSDDRLVQLRDEIMGGS